MAAAAATEASALTLVSTIHIRLSLSPRLRSSNLCFRKRNPISPPFTVVSGPRDNRPPLSRGRTMSTEAILTVQALKRARGDEAAVDRIVSTKVSRLIKADLLASIAELERQDQWYLALKVFASARRENWYRTDCALYADMVAVLARSMKDAEIDLLMVELMEALEREGGIAAGDLRGPARLVKALIAAKKGKAVMEVL
ncbi:hypothetical protein HPP92_003237 [Vanilla planifolia]|uniref:Uncharacterized protein n=1 Tax=Vanilla planifolia TaxID=51239 RepID=A0A835RUI0_VANPL|nr:hypothetical protein HPP92_003237 [Vanilla planifolia]